MIADYHLHTHASPDGTGKMSDYVRAAKEREINEIGFSEHALLRPLSRRSDSFVSKMPCYVQNFFNARENSGITLKLGIEVDFFPDEIDKISRFIQTYPFDYVIGSVHVIGDWIFDDSLEKNEFSRRDTLQIYDEYFSLVRSAANSRLFDILGHPDIIKIFGARPKTDFSQILEETAKTLAQSGICAEINTRGLRRPCRDIYPSEQFLRILHKHNVPVTFGSDAHAPRDVGRDFSEAAALAKRVGYTNACTFDSRKRCFVRI